MNTCIGVFYSQWKLSKYFSKQIKTKLGIYSNIYLLQIQLDGILIFNFRITFVTCPPVHTTMTSSMMRACKFVIDRIKINICYW